MAKFAIMPAKIRRLMPLPRPFSVIRSPIHMARAVPVARQKPMVNTFRKPSAALRPVVRATAWRKPRPTVT